MGSLAVARMITLSAAIFLLSSALLFQSPGAEGQEVPLGPWLDEIIWSEEPDSSLALTRLLNGEADLVMSPLRVLADIERARSSDRVREFATYQVFDTFLMNPTERKPEHPRNPFVIDEVREAMQWLIDRDLIIREIWKGTAIPHATPWHPRSADYSRAIGDLLALEEEYAYNPAKGREKMFAALGAEGWFIGQDGLWHDPEGRLVTLKGIVRKIDERFLMGAYYADLFAGLHFDVLRPRPDLAYICGPFSCPPDADVWNYYTAGWVQAGSRNWDDQNLLRWNCGLGYENYCVQRPEDTRNRNVYVVNQELANLSDRISLGDYSSMEERARLIARGTELSLKAPIRIFIDARQSAFAFHERMEGTIMDLFAGPLTHWAFRSARVPVDATTGLRTARLLNQYMFIDGWNPWLAAPGWRHDEIQRWTMTDPGMARHPHIGRYMDLRTHASVETGGFSGAVPVPSTAVAFDVNASTWISVGEGVSARSKVTLDITLGKWHHSVAVSLDDLIYHLSNGYRRSFGDASKISELRSTASANERRFYGDQMVGIRPLDEDSIEIYLDFWHIDPQEIGGLASAFVFPTYPWEVGELALQTVLDLETVNNEADAGRTGRTWLDLTKGSSLLFLEEDLPVLKARIHIPPGMEVYITSGEASARWDSLSDWYAAKGHFWPSQGPFYLEEVDLTNRTTTMKAFREYPFRADHWQDLTRLRIPEVTVRNAPAFVLPGGKAVFDLMVTVAGTLDESVTVRWFLKDLSTREFVAEGVEAPVVPGAYRIELSSTFIEELGDGNFEFMAVASGTDLALSVIARTGFAIVPKMPDTLSYLCPAVLGGCPDSMGGLSREIREVQEEIDRLDVTLTSAELWIYPVLILSSASLVMSTVVVARLNQRRSGRRFR